ncbi:FadR/GntR family transcriptional regulator [Dictyobacter aurantiacus]|uniref:GntR family transcriptional regulator n=1 Tax=Dictyobacter aurantiacus TaxID=1936993 RepID=A0A401ZLZ9_9CHLR|nr:FadR/GntR family transcriptional regulator [Dictyobacter aurantiacus]GCE07858.1 GntR family transcriptional regulator [Dictyobacter aurantiacus]
MQDKIQRQQVYEVVMKSLKKDIESGKLKAGDRLATMRELAVHFGVGQSSVREAIRVLSHMGLLYVKHGGGIFVNERRAWEQTPATSGVLVEGVRTSLLHLLELRLAIEPMAARLAAIRATEEECQEIQQRCDEVQLIHQQNLKVYQEQSASEESISQEEDVLFHMTIVRAAHNPFLLETLEHVHGQLREGRQITWLVPQLVNSALHFHPQITESILTHDALRAESFMRAHLEDVVWWLELYDTQNQGKHQDDAGSTGSSEPGVPQRAKGVLATELTKNSTTN